MPTRNPATTCASTQPPASANIATKNIKYPPHIAEMKKTLPPTLTPEFVSELLNVNVNSLRNWRSSGTGPPFAKPGGRVLYFRDLFLDWLAQQ